METMPKTSPEMGKVKLPRAVSSKAITSPAPRDAPLETPKVKGEARGFLSTDCTVTPHTERALPRGLLPRKPPPRKLQRISLLFPVSFVIIENVRVHRSCDLVNAVHNILRRTRSCVCADAVYLAVFYRRNIFPACTAFYFAEIVAVVLNV